MKQAHTDVNHLATPHVAAQPRYKSTMGSEKLGAAKSLSVRWMSEFSRELMQISEHGLVHCATLPSRSEGDNMPEVRDADGRCQVISRSLTVCTAEARIPKATDGRTSPGTRSGRHRRIAAQHSYARPEFRPTKRDHVLADVTGHDFTVLRARVCQDILDEIIAVLIARNCRPVSINAPITSGIRSCLAYYQ